jgi:hypothetical protein
MSWRLISGIIACMVGLAINTGLLWEEYANGIYEGKPTEGVKAGPEDPLLGMRFVATARKANLEAMGFDERETAEMVSMMGRMEQQFHLGVEGEDVLVERLEVSRQLDDLRAAFCGADARGGLPVRYAAMEFLVGDEHGPMEVLPLTTPDGFEPQDWRAKSQVDRVYQVAELAGDGRQPDATRMAFAAILAKDEVSLIEHKSPFGQSFWAGWSWEKVRAKHPGISGLVHEYVQAMHLVLEAANGEQGICAGEAGEL